MDVEHMEYLLLGAAMASPEWKDAVLGTPLEAFSLKARQHWHSLSSDDRDATLKAALRIVRTRHLRSQAVAASERLSVAARLMPPDDWLREALELFAQQKKLTRDLE